MISKQDFTESAKGVIPKKRKAKTMQFRDLKPKMPDDFVDAEIIRGNINQETIKIRNNPDRNP